MTESELLPIATGRRTATALRALARPYRWLAVVALLTLVVATGASLLTAPLLGRIVDLAVSGRPVGELTAPVATLAGLALAQGLLVALGVALLARLGEAMLARLRERFVAHALGLSLERVEGGGSGDLTSRVTEDVAVIGEAVREALPNFVRSALIISLTLVGLAALDWRFLLGALLAVPLQVATARWYVSRSGPIYAAQRVAAGAEQQQLLDSVGAATTVRAFRLAPGHLDRVTERATRSADLAVSVVVLQTRFFGRLNAAEFLGLGGVLLAGFLAVRADVATVGVASAAALYFHALFGPINAVLFLLDTAQSATASLARLIGVVDVEPEPEPAHPGRPADGSVVVDGVGHAYRSGHDVLREVSLSVADGSRIALVGASGAGKTTLAKLVAGVHRPVRGGIRLGGVELADLGPAATRRTVVLVTQEVHVFAGPLTDDLRLARPEASDDELRAALTAVGALDWATALPDGLDTVVGAGGVELTVVQAQQLALARLVLLDPPIAILDEATAEAGSSGARVLEDAASRALAGRTGLVVAHRLTQAAQADLIVVLDDGRIVEHGTHADLVGAGGRYADLWSAWSGARVTETVLPK